MWNYFVSMYLCHTCLEVSRKLWKNSAYINLLLPMNDDICDNNNTSGFANGYNMTMLIVIDNVKKK
jgi:hypothetical protein